MLSKNRIFSYIFLLSLFPGQIISCNILKSADELACLFVLLLAGLDIYVNGRETIRRLLPLWITFGIMGFYVLYSVLFRSFNTPLYVVIDMVSQIKPFIPYLVVFCLGLQLTEWAKQVGRWLCLVNIFFMAVFYVWGRGQLILPFAHISFMGSITFISSLVYLYCSLDADNRLSQRDMITVVCMLTFGLLCGRSKYFGEYILTMVMLFFYRPRMLSKISFRMVLGVVALLCLIVVVAWTKIEYYFIQGTAEVIANGSLEDLDDSFARPVLYFTGGQILLDYFPFGSGLASFASFASASNYSTLYYEYGLDKVWGLSPAYSEFVCDAYYPTLCQFGIVGVAVFVYFWRWIIRRMNQLDLLHRERFRNSFVVCFGLLTFIFIESIGSTFFIQATGAQAMMLLGLICTPHSKNEISQ